VRKTQYIPGLFNRWGRRKENVPNLELVFRCILPHADCSPSLHFFTGLTMIPPMKIKLHHPPREITLKGPKQVDLILKELNLSKEAHLVICRDELVTDDAILPDDEVVEIRPVISGG
jgi:sulfur carrier protein